MKRPQKRTKATSKRRRKTSKRAKKTNLLALFSIFILFAAGLGIGYFVGVRTKTSSTTSIKVTSVEIKPVPKIKTEERRKEEIPEIAEGKPKKTFFRARIAIVIDDFGYRKVDIDRFKKLPYPIAISIIPFTPYEKYSAIEAIKSGKSVMLHIPMEPNSNGEKIEKLEKETKGMLRITMSEAKIRSLLRKEIRRIPYAVGANNHMGSKFTRYGKGMKIVLEELRRAGLFFLDSRTVSNSLGVYIGKKLGILVLRRDVFLDNSQDVEYIKHQLDELARIALKKGYAIAIGHPHISTLLALEEKLPELEKRGIKVVPIEEIYSYLGGKYASGFQKTGSVKRREVSFLSRMSSRNSP